MKDYKNLTIIQKIYLKSKFKEFCNLSFEDLSFLFSIREKLEILENCVKIKDLKLC